MLRVAFSRASTNAIRTCAHRLGQAEVGALSNAYELVEANAGATSACAFFLHGILGSRRNWLSFARRVVSQHPQWRLVLVDLRNHGESHGAPGPHTLAACAQDLGELAAALGEEPRVVVGHSFGGKVALVYARDVAAELDDLWVLDSSPGTYLPRGTGSVEQVIRTISSLSLPIAGRRELVQALQDQGLSLSLAQWMTTNLRPAPGGFVWRFDLDAVREMLIDYAATDLWPWVENPPPGYRTHFVQGGRSDRWTDDDRERLARGQRAGLDLHVLPNAGHWVHTDDPDALFAVMEPTWTRWTPSP